MMEATQKLDGLWEFAFQDEKAGDCDVTQMKFTTHCYVPGCFDLLPDFKFLRGIGVYRRMVEASGHSRLTLEGIGLRGKVFWDGREIHSIETPFTLEKIDFDAGKKGTHELLIACDNRFDRSESSMFRSNYDFYAHGGIYRSVSIVPLPETWIENIAIRTI